VIVVILAYPKIFNKDKFATLRDEDGRISVAVMPFENLTGDTTLNWFQRGISTVIINGLGSSSELAVRDDHTMYEVMESMNQVFTSGISPSQAKEVAEKARAETYISGSYQGREDTYWILANLVDAETGEIISTNKVKGDLNSSEYLELADSLCNEIKDYLEIKMLEQEADYDFREAYTKSAEAYRYFNEGMYSILSLDYESGIEFLNTALKIDSTFTFATFYIAYAYAFSYQLEQANIWTQKAYNIKNRLPSKYQLWLDQWYAFFISKNLPDIIRYGNLLEESGIENRLLLFDLGDTYHYIRQYEKAIEAFEKIEEISLERGGEWEYVMFYYRYGEDLHKVGKHEKEKEISEIGLSFPNSSYILWNQAGCALSRGDTIEANEYLEKVKSVSKNEYGFLKLDTEMSLGYIYEEASIIDKAEEHYRSAFEMAPQDINAINDLAYFLIDNDINVDEGMELIQKGLEIEPDYWELLLGKGLGRYKQCNFEEAIKLYKGRKKKVLNLIINFIKQSRKQNKPLSYKTDELSIDRLASSDQFLTEGILFYLRMI
jgi:tetratricopeptide (TPR) repeat protein